MSIKFLREDLKRLEARREKDVKTDNLNVERQEYVLHFLVDKLGYEIKLKDVIKVNYKGEKSIATEVEMVEKQPLTVKSSLYDLVNAATGCCGSEEPKPKRKYNKRNKNTAKKKQVNK